MRSIGLRHPAAAGRRSSSRSRSGSGRGSSRRGCTSLENDLRSKGRILAHTKEVELNNRALVGQVFVATASAASVWDRGHEAGARAYLIVNQVSAVGKPPLW